MDGTMRLPSRYEHLPVTWRDDSIGAWPAWYLALAELILLNPDADAYVMLQDDVVCFDREPLREYLERTLWPGTCPGLVTLFYTGLNPTAGWHEAQGAWHFSAQGFVIAPGIARALLCDEELSRTLLAASLEKHIPIPEIISAWTKHVGIDVWYANPSLTQHIGNTSTIWMDASIKAGRRAPWFSGSVETEYLAEESLDDFPEDEFLCVGSDAEHYQNDVELGRHRMQDLSVVICGLCRDVRRYLPRTAARIERLGSMFRDYKTVVFENDSTDGTQQFLADWSSQNPGLDVICESNGPQRFPQTRSLDRAAWMAHCRNQYRQRVAERYSDYDCVIVVDMDLPGGWSYDGIAHTFAHDDWDFVGSYGIQRLLDRHLTTPPVCHYDVWAFRPAPGTPARKLVNHNQLFLSRGEPLMPVESCFGGLGVYRMECMLSADYGGSDCEHVVLHERLIAAGFDRLFLNPNQIVLYTPI